MGKGKQEDTGAIFFSYEEGNQNSRDIVERVRKFFESWRVTCHVVREHVSGQAPRDEIKRLILQESDVFLQVFGDDFKITEWMRTEVHWAETATRVEWPPAVLFTERTRHDARFRELKEPGTWPMYQIDDPEKARVFLTSMLVKLGRLGKNPGKIELPSWCRRESGIQLDALEEFIRSFRGSHERGLKSVYTERADAVRKALLPRMERFEDKGGMVRMAGFTLKRFVHPEEELGEIFQRALEGKGKARLLALDPMCSAAVERARIESPGRKHPQKSLLGIDGKKVRDHYFPKKRARYLPETLDYRYYKTPYVGLVVFDDEAFVELYHLGQQVGDKGICGKVPVLLFGRRDEEDCFYNLVSSHFDNLWELGQSFSNI